jgi:ArsR family transcriptional regulator, zinc-responsive transcriptional repressor
MRQRPAGRYESAGELFKALGSPVRLALVDLLATRPRYVHELVEMTGLTQPHVSQHLRVLRQAGVVRGVRRHREIAYALRDERVARIVREALARDADDGPAPVEQDAGSAA